MRTCVAIVFVIWLVLAALSAQLFRRLIEVRLGAAARRSLDARGLEMVAAEFDHLDVTLSGIVPDLEMKLAAAEAMGELECVRVRENLISYGEAPAAHLIFADGDPVRVSGELGEGVEALRLGEGFDCGAVSVARRADIPWSDQVGELAGTFFKVVKGGWLELEGRRVVMGGEVANPSVRWMLIDRVQGLGGYVELTDRLRIISPSPFAIRIRVERGAWSFSGVVRDETSLAALGARAPGADTEGISIDPRVADPEWLWRVADPIRRCVWMAESATFALSPHQFAAAANFPSQFWLEVAEECVRDSLPDGIEPELDFQVVQPAVAVGIGSAEQGQPRLPIRLSVAAGRLRVEGLVTQPAERAEIIAKLHSARPDLVIQDALTVDRSARYPHAIRESLPDVLAFAASGVSGDASLVFDAKGWRFSAICRGPEFVDAASRLASAVEHVAGIPVDLDLSLDRWQDPSAADWTLGRYPIYFKAGSVQISPGQDEKIAHLADLLASMAASGAREFTLTGFDRGAGRLAQQRARIVRRLLARNVAENRRIDVRAGSVAPPVGWHSDRVTASIGIAPPPGQVGL